MGAEGLPVTGRLRAEKAIRGIASLEKRRPETRDALIEAADYLAASDAAPTPNTQPKENTMDLLTDNQKNADKVAQALRAFESLLLSIRVADETDPAGTLARLKREAAGYVVALNDE